MFYCLYLYRLCLYRLISILFTSISFIVCIYIVLSMLFMSISFRLYLYLISTIYTIPILFISFISFILKYTQILLCITRQSKPRIISLQSKLFVCRINCYLSLAESALFIAYYLIFLVSLAGKNDNIARL